MHHPEKILWNFDRRNRKERILLKQFYSFSFFLGGGGSRHINREVPTLENLSDLVLGINLERAIPVWRNQEFTKSKICMTLLFSTYRRALRINLACSGKS